MAFKRSAVRSRLSPPEGNRGKALGHNGPGLFSLRWRGVARWDIACLKYITWLSLSLSKRKGRKGRGSEGGLGKVIETCSMECFGMFAAERSGGNCRRRMAPGSLCMSDLQMAERWSKEDSNLHLVTGMQLCDPATEQCF